MKHAHTCADPSMILKKHAWYYNPLYECVVQETFWLFSRPVSHVFVCVCCLALMSLARSDTARTMMSKANSTSELCRGMEYIMCDSNGFPQLPENLDELEDPVFSLMITVKIHLKFQELMSCDPVIKPSTVINRYHKISEHIINIILLCGCWTVWCICMHVSRVYGLSCLACATSRRKWNDNWKILRLRSPRLGLAQTVPIQWLIDPNSEVNDWYHCQIRYHVFSLHSLWWTQSSNLNPNFNG